MKLYSNLSKIRLLKRYSAKFLAIAFLGIHIPLIGLIVFLTFNEGVLSPTVILFFTLILTLGATAVTLFILNSLLEPIHLARNSLKSYLESQELPVLPTHFKDEVGELLKDLQFSIIAFDNLIESKQQTIAILSHDLRNPCSNILMLVELLKLEKDADEKEDLMNRIKTSAEQQMALMESTLLNLRSESKNHGKLEMENINLQTIIAEVINIQKVALETKKINLEFNHSIDLNIKGNEAALKQVFTNLISNAIKFSHQEGKIWIKAKKKEKEIHIDVTDEGLGFQMENSEALFKPFTEYSRLGTQGESSQGMGLFITRRFVYKHSGQLIAKSEGLNRGATFSIRLPHD